MFILFKKLDLDNDINYPNSKLHVNFVSVSEQLLVGEHDITTNFNYYSILLITSNPKLSTNHDNYPKFDYNIINKIQHTRKPDIQTNKGDKHNSSYGDYYGFGIIKK